MEDRREDSDRNKEARIEGERQGETDRYCRRRETGAHQKIEVLIPISFIL